MVANVFTIGHSTRTAEALIAMLRAHGVTCLADVRTIPKSRHNPQFNREDLSATLNHHGISYIHLPELGGLRHPRKDSINTGWQNASFRGYADYMQTLEFETGLERLLEIARNEVLTIMCAEAVPWRCHRSMIADALTARGVHVEHMMSESKTQPHALTPFAQVQGVRIIYPGIEHLQQS
ncbi:MAG TPA: DUF488 domain-containing protein [Bryobacteraceae bacterium]|nr:DUF488 domain-containing protein [Bryobacteraceae bacterium]